MEKNTMQILFHPQWEIFGGEVVTLKKEPLSNLALFLVCKFACYSDNHALNRNKCTFQIIKTVIVI